MLALVLLLVAAPAPVFGLDALIEQLERMEPENYPQTHSALLERAEAGDPEASYWMGRLLHDYAPLPLRDFEGGREWLERAAEAGHVGAANMLGRVYEVGFIVQNDLERARHYYRLATENGSANAPHDLARLEFGRETRDNEEILRLLSLAAERGHRNAVVDLGFMHASGTLGEVDGNKARQWAERGIEMRDPRAMNLMARLYATGLGVSEPDGVEALKWAILARDLGNEEATELAREIADQLPEELLQEGRQRARAWQENNQ